MKAMQKGRGDGQPFERLREGPAGDLETPQAVLRAQAAMLIESAEPFGVPAGRKDRVLRRLGQTERRRRTGRWRPILVAGILVGSGAIASAGLTHWPTWVARSVGQLVMSAPNQTPAPPAVARPLRAAPSPEQPAEEAPAVEPAPPRAGAVERHARRGFVLEDPSLLVEATRALRHTHNPRRARALAARYLAAHPTGALAEEALAISIEASLEEHAPDCAQLSRRYLELYPHGSFRTYAERGLSGGSKAPQR